MRVKDLEFDFFFKLFNCLCICWKVFAYLSIKTIIFPPNSNFFPFNKTFHVCFLIIMESLYIFYSSFPEGSDSKQSICNGGHPVLIPGWRRCPGEGNGYPLQYSCLENSMDRGARWSTVHGVAKSKTLSG